jgi:hypothetical protein
MNLDNLTIKEVKELTSLLNHTSVAKANPFQIGKAYLIRTVTMTLVGRLKAVYDQELVLSEASWIADTGRFSDTLKKGESNLNEVEPFYADVIVGRGSIVDATEWSHTTELKQK